MGGRASARPWYGITPSTGEVGLAMGVSAQNRRQNPNIAEQGGHHLDPSVIQKAVLRAVHATGLIRPALGGQQGREVVILRFQ